MKVGELREADAAPEASDSIDALERGVAALCAHGSVRVPAYPAVALRVQEAMARKDFGLAEVAQIVGSDAVLAADILRCANSALYRRGGPVTDLTAAITRIGAQQVLRLLFASGLGATVHAAGPLVPLRRMFWIEGLASAAVSQELAALRGLRSEEAFVLGLLHDFGKIVGVTCLETLVEEKGFEGRFPFEVWADVSDRQHVALGAVAAKRWRLPPLVAEVIAAHHDPAAACREKDLLEVVRASDAVVALMLERPRVTAADLAGIAAIRPGERAAVEAAVENVPEFVAAFESGAAAAAASSPRIAPPMPIAAEEGRPRPARRGAPPREPAARGEDLFRGPLQDVGAVPPVPAGGGRLPRRGAAVRALRARARRVGGDPGRRRHAGAVARRRSTPQPTG